MKYIAAIIVALGFYWYFVASAPKEEQAPPVVVEIVRPGELSSVEKEYYLKVFDYTMDQVAPGKAYAWQANNGNHGKINVDKPFTSKSSAICRKFSETFTIGGMKGEADGVACKRNGEEGWCRLKKSNALTCALEQPATIANFDFPGMYYAPGINVGVGGINAPNVNMPGAPAVNTDAANGDKVSGKGYAETVTRGAGSAAGPVTGGLIGWFNDTFRK